MNLGISRLYCPSLPKLNMVQWATALCLSKLLEDPVFLCSCQTLYSIYLWLSIFEHIIKCNCKTTGLTSLDSHNSKQLWISGCDCAAATWHYVMFFFYGACPKVVPRHLVQSWIMIDEFSPPKSSHVYKLSHGRRGSCTFLKEWDFL